MFVRWHVFYLIGKIYWLCFTVSFYYSREDLLLLVPGPNSLHGILTVLLAVLVKILGHIRGCIPVPIVVYVVHWLLVIIII